MLNTTIAPTWVTLLLGLVVMWILCGGEKLELLDQIGAEDDGVESDKSALKWSDHYQNYDGEAEDDEGDKSGLEGPDELATGKEDWWKIGGWEGDTKRP